MHGTDHPFWPMPFGPRLLDELDLTASERARIEHLNAERLFGIGAPAPEAR